MNQEAKVIPSIVAVRSTNLQPVTFSTTARSMAGLIDLSALNQLVPQVQAITSGLEKPGFTESIGIVVYVYTLIQMGVIQAVLFFITSFGFVAIGVGSLLIQLPYQADVYLTRTYLGSG